MGTCRAPRQVKGKLWIIAVLYPAISAVWFAEAEEGVSATSSPQHPHPHPLSHDQYHNAPMPATQAFHRIYTRQTTNEEANEKLSQAPIVVKPLPRVPVVVLARYTEDVKWISVSRKQAKKAFQAVIYQSSDRKGPNFVPNRGYEATKYLKFIIDNYDALPPKVLFLHAHAKAGHSPCSAMTFLLRWPWKSGHQHLSLPATFKTFPYEGYSEWNTIKWIDLLRFGQELAGLEPRPYNASSRLMLPMNAQFMVSRERILQHPRELYVRLYEAGIQPCKPPEWMLERHPKRPFITAGCDMNRLFGLAMEISLQAILSYNQPRINWVQGKKKGCPSICNNRDGLWCLQ